MTVDDSELQILRATAGDIDSIRGIAARANLDTWAESDLEIEIGRKDSIILIASDPAGTSFGFVIGRILPSSDLLEDRTAEIFQIAVKPEMGRSGIGIKLLQRFASICKREGIRSIWLEVRESNSKAIDFYEKYGFEPVHTRRDYYRDPVEDAIVMKSTI